MSFIPSFHFKPAEEKLTREWCNEAIQFYYYQNNLIPLLKGKKIDEINGFAYGDFSLAPFKKMFRSLRAQTAASQNQNIPKENLESMDGTGIGWEQLALITPKLNAAIATLQKIPFEVKATCIDPLAQKKKKEDLEFLRNKPEMEDALQEVYDSLNIGSPDMGATKYSSRPYTALPFDLDGTDDEEFMVFANMIYNLAPEAALEIILEKYADVLNLDQIRLLEMWDQYKFGISVDRGYGDKMTGLPNAEYVHPGTMKTDGSLLNDHSDNVVRTQTLVITPLELFRRFPDDICGEDDLEEIVGNTGSKDDWNSGYCFCNRGDTTVNTSVTRNDWGRFKMILEYVEVKSVDYAMVGQKKKSGYSYITNDEKKCARKIWGENTYCFYWLKNTKYFFGIDRLGYAHRKKGMEVKQAFSTNIYKSQTKSAVELCIGENKKAQIADIKLQHAVIMSMPPGKVLDLKYIRNVIEGLKEEPNNYTVQQLIDLAMEKNIHIIDTDGFENKQNAGQYLPTRDLPGGLKNELEGYYRVILEANAKIDMITNINAQLTGQSANPEGLVGLQKLLINSSLNGIYYVNVAILKNNESLYNLMAYYVSDAIKKGGSTRSAIENIVGENKVEILEGMDDMSEHEMTVKLALGQREEERAEFKYEVENMRKEKRIDAIGKYYILNTKNPKDAMFLLAMFEKKAQKREDMIRKQQAQDQQALVKQQGENSVANSNAQTQGKIAVEQTKAQGEAQLLQLGGQIGMSKDQINGLIKRQLQKERMEGAENKALRTQSLKSNLDQQQPLI